MNSEILKKLLVDGSLLKHTMIKISTLVDQVTGLRKQRTSTPPLKVLEVKAFGAIKTVFATGERSAFRNIFPRARDLKVSGKTPRRSAAFSESSFSLMKKIPDCLLKDSKRLMSLAATPIPLLDITTILRTCQLTIFQKLITNKLIEF